MEIKGNQIIAAEGKTIYRKSDKNRQTPIKAAIILKGETLSDFVEIDDADIPTEELRAAIEAKIAEITAYDTSSAVNGLTYNGRFLWLPKEDRLSLTDRFTREMAKGLEKTNLYYNGEAIEVTPQQGLALVQEVSAYADKCFDNTQKHLAAVQALTTLEEVLSYDYTTGYPEKLQLKF